MCPSRGCWSWENYIWPLRYTVSWSTHWATVVPIFYFLLIPVMLRTCSLSTKTRIPLAFVIFDGAASATVGREDGLRKALITDCVPESSGLADRDPDDLRCASSCLFLSSLLLMGDVYSSHSDRVQLLKGRSCDLRVILSTRDQFRSMDLGDMDLCFWNHPCP